VRVRRRRETRQPWPAKLRIDPASRVPIPIKPSLKPGGSLWISDFIDHSIPAVHQLMWERYGDYLTNLKDTAYRDHVFEYVQREDSPRPLLFQIDLLREGGFRDIDVLHKNSCFAVFGGIKGGKSFT
jgi:tRNA (cmo5U34)-methyltransferase